MRILQMLDIPWHSGLADYAFSLARALEAAGHRCQIAAPPGSRASQAAAAAGLSVVPFCAPSTLPALRRFIRDEGIDLLNAHTGTTHVLSMLAAAWPASSAARGRSSGPQHLADSRPPRRATRPAVVRTRADRRTLRPRPGWQLLAARTERFIGATEGIRRQFLAAYRLPEDRTRAIFPAVDLPAVWSAPVWRGMHATPGPVVTVLGRLDPVKGHHAFLRAAARVRARIPSATFALVGRAEGFTPDDLQGEAASLGIGAAVTCPGHVPSITPWITASTLGVIPSVGSEAVSRAALEWMAHGRAVVASAVGGLPEFVEEGRTGLLVPPNDDAALADAILELLGDPARLGAFPAGGGARAATFFSPARLGAETIEVYEEALRCV